MTKTYLDPRDKLKAAFLYEFYDIPQHVLAVFFEVNMARINEAIAVSRAAFDLPKSGSLYELGEIPAETLNEVLNRIPQRVR